MTQAAWEACVLGSRALAGMALPPLTQTAGAHSAGVACGSVGHTSVHSSFCALIHVVINHAP